MTASQLDLPDKWSFIHAAIGGAICFLVTILISDLIQVGLQQILINSGCFGVVSFEEFAIARDIIMFGVVYLSSGFCGGLYTGYQTDENLRIVLLIPGVIGFIAVIILTYFLGYLNLSNMNFIIKSVILPLIGNVIGAYLGGYTMNWPSEEDVPEVEKLTLDLE